MANFPQQGELVLLNGAEALEQSVSAKTIHQKMRTGLIAFQMGNSFSYLIR